jgi:alkylation response protein AidB-like acyl-CoA dehydrogenase
MFIDYTEEQAMLKKTIRRFVDHEIVPLETEYDMNRPFSKADIKRLWKKILPLLWDPTQGAGILGTPSLGGKPSAGIMGTGIDLDLISIGIIIEEMFRGNASLTATMLMSVAPAGFIMMSSNQAMKDRYVLPLLMGEKIGCTSLTEPDYGSNSRDIKTTAVKKGDSWVINGTKTWISNADISDLTILSCRCDDGDGILYTAQLLVDREVSPYETRELSHMGLKAFPTGEIIFEDVKVPLNNKLSGRKESTGEGYKKTLMGFEVARTIMALGSVGIAQAAIDASIKYACQRRQFGKFLGEFQMIQEMICDMMTMTESARLLAYRALSLIQIGKRAEEAACMAKQYATEMAVDVTSKAIQIHGAYGLSEEFPLERLFRDARMFTIPDGTTQIQKLIIARSALGGLSAIS